MKSLGQIAYDAYAEQMGKGSPIQAAIPHSFGLLEPERQAAWDAAGDAVTAALLEKIPPAITTMGPVCFHLGYSGPTENCPEHGKKPVEFAE